VTELELSSPSEAEGPVLSAISVDTLILGSLPIGARLVIRCRNDWRDATVVACREEKTVLSVGSPSGRTYRLRRPSDSILLLDGCIPVLGEGSWKPSMAKYDLRW
jgi:hypothetical protein